MEQLEVFANREFGSIRTLRKNGDVWFVAKDVAEILGYADPNKAIAVHVDEEDRLNDKTASSLGQRGGWLINESGLYGLILSSKMPNAKKFKCWVTSEVLPSIRKTGSYDMHRYSPEMQAILMHDEKLVKIDSRVTDLENNMTIDYGQQVALGEEVTRSVLRALGGKESNAYNEVGKKVFAECNRDLKYYFHVNARNNVPKKRFEEAVEYIQGWQPCTNTQILIRDCNAQVCM